MLLPRFDYQRPSHLDAALALLAQAGGEARPLAGGTDLLVNLKLGKVACRLVVDLDGVDELKAVSGPANGLGLGALVTAAWLARQAGGLGLMGLAEAGAALGSPQVRNRATVGGNLCTARPAGDLATALLALGAGVVLAGPSGRRELPVSEFITGPGLTAIAPGEILVAARPAAEAALGGGAFEKLGLRRTMEIALVSAAAWVQAATDGRTIQAARVALGAVGPTPLLASAAAAALVGQPAGQEAFAAAANAAAEAAKPIDDHRGSADYRRQMVAVLTHRALERAWARALESREATA